MFVSNLHRHVRTFNRVSFGVLASRPICLGNCLCLNFSLRDRPWGLPLCAHPVWYVGVLGEHYTQQAFLLPLNGPWSTALPVSGCYLLLSCVPVEWRSLLGTPIL